MRETITEWLPEEKIVIAVDNVEKQFFKHASMTITLSDDGQATPFTMAFGYEPKEGPLATLTGQFSTGSSRKVSTRS